MIEEETPQEVDPAAAARAEIMAALDGSTLAAAEAEAEAADEGEDGGDEAA